MLFDIVASLTNKFGKDWINFDPETFPILLPKTNEYSMEIINALLVLIVSDAGWNNPFIFENIVDALNENSVIPEIVTKPSLLEIAFTIKEMNSLRRIPFGEDVKKYIAAIAMDELFIVLPEELSFADKYMEHQESDLAKKLLSLRKNLQSKELSDATAFDIQYGKLLSFV